MAFSVALCGFGIVGQLVPNRSATQSGAQMLNPSDLLQAPRMISFGRG
jgi:hypothetical protein